MNTLVKTALSIIGFGIAMSAAHATDTYTPLQHNTHKAVQNYVVKLYSN